MRFLLVILVNGLILYGAAAIFSGIAVSSYVDAVIVALVLALVNTFVRPILVLLTLPLTIVTFGLFLLIVNGAMVLLTDWLLDGFWVKDWFWAIVLSLIFSIFGLAMTNKRYD